MKDNKFLIKQTADFKTWAKRAGWFVVTLIKIESACKCISVCLYVRMHVCLYSFLRHSKAATGGILWEKVFLEISKKSQEDTCERGSFLIKLQASSCNFIKKETLVQVFYCESCKISKNIFFTEHLWATVFGRSWLTDQTDLTDSMSFLLYRLMEEINPNPQALRGHTVSL